MKQNTSSNKSLVIPAKAGIQSIEKFPRSGTSVFFVGYAETFISSWIPACAGMTELTGHQL
jgi:hypothetical protein